MLFQTGRPKASKRKDSNLCHNIHVEIMNSRLGLYGSSEHDCEPAIPIDLTRFNNMYFVCSLLVVLYTDYACVARLRRGGS